MERSLAARVSPNLATRISIALLALGALFVLWHELEPLLTFRPVDAVVASVGVRRLATYSRFSGRGHYEPEILYRYQVAGQTYMGRHYRRSLLSASLGVARQHASAFVAGGTVRAWYNPLRPSEAVLSRAPNTQLLLCAFFTPLLGWYSARRRRPRVARAAATPAPIN
jgi:hypothetical protein